MIAVNYPPADFRIREEGGKKFLFDPIRKSWLLLTPEEWVRQNFVNYLIRSLSYPVAFVALEKSLVLHDLKKRFDILVYDPRFQPWMMVECKAPEVPLTQLVLEQLLRYHISIPVHFLVLCNGHHTMAWHKYHDQLHQLTELPPWPK